MDNAEVVGLCGYDLINPLLVISDIAANILPSVSQGEPLSHVKNDFAVPGMSESEDWLLEMAMMFVLLYFLGVDSSVNIDW